jgi:hypothetical protein
MTMNAIAFSRASGLTYVHTPFTRIEHAERPMREWVSAWEALFSLGAGEAPCDAGRREAVDFSHSFLDLLLCLGWRGRGEELAHRFGATIPEFRRRYYLNKSPCTAGKVTVAVHIRRGDALESDPDYFIRTEVILRTIEDVKSILDAHAIGHGIRIYSQGKIADFAELSSLRAEWFLDADAIWTMQELIEADILILSKGCFSYYAGLISDGIKIFAPVAPSGDLFPVWPFHLIPTDDWLPCLADGSFDREAFERRLILLMQAKR